MGWSGANSIFNPIAQALIDARADDTTKRKVLGDLIHGLQDGDWDTEDESLEDFLGDPAIVSAFADHNVHLSDRRCCAREVDADARKVIIGMRSDDVTEEAITEVLDAYARHLGQQIRDDANLRAIEGEQKLAIYGRELADLITPKAARP